MNARQPPVDAIRAVWGDYDDFRDGGWNYVAWVIHEQLREMEESDWDDATCRREMTDVVICALRAIDELGKLEPPTAINYRLDAAHDGRQAEIIERYQRNYEIRL